ncbi:MAG: hypothetical protein IH987_16305 [Planctomycetes bacterium]|nr:hypothetical protein [Planctomycetota bacterium]
MKPRSEEKKSRFRIEKLEERIAPSAINGFDTGRGHGQCHKDLGGPNPAAGGNPSPHSSLAPDTAGNCPRGAAG